MARFEIVRTAAVSVAFAAAVFGQAQAPAAGRVFEVATVKANRSGPPAGTMTFPFAFQPGGRFTATNVTLVDVITQAYGTRRIQMQGGPNWIDSERFDIVAKADAADGEVKPEDRPQMMRALLEDRFKLVWHTEKKETQVLALVGTVPPAFTESHEGSPASTPGEHGKLTFRHMPITGLVNLTSNVLHTPVVDGTGIQGFYDFAIDPSQFAGTGAESTPGAARSYADLFEIALREQFGFKLERRKAPLEIMVIDSASRPSEN